MRQLLLYAMGLFLPQMLFLALSVHCNPWSYFLPSFALIFVFLIDRTSLWFCLAMSFLLGLMWDAIFFGNFSYNTVILPYFAFVLWMISFRVGELKGPMLWLALFCMGVLYRLVMNLAFALNLSAFNGFSWRIILATSLCEACFACVLLSYYGRVLKPALNRHESDRTWIWHE